MNFGPLSPVSTVGPAILVGAPVPSHCPQGLSFVAESEMGSVFKFKESVRSVLRVLKSPARSTIYSCSQVYLSGSLLFLLVYVPRSCGLLIVR